MKNIFLKSGLLAIIINIQVFGPILSMGNEQLVEFNAEMPNTLMKQFVNNPSGSNLRSLLNLLDLIKESDAESALTAQNLLQAEIDEILKVNPEKFAQFDDTRTKHYQSKISEFKSSKKYLKVQDEAKRIEKLDKNLNSLEQINKDLEKIGPELKEANNKLLSLQKQLESTINLKTQGDSSGIRSIEEENRKLTKENQNIAAKIKDLEEEIKSAPKLSKKRKL